MIEDPEPASFVSVPTAPSPPEGLTNPFEMIDDVPAEDEVDQISEVQKLRTDVPGTMTPPLTPTTSHTANCMGELDEGSKQLLTILGGYGFRC